jgi:hypothetical protein
MFEEGIGERQKGVFMGFSLRAHLCSLVLLISALCTPSAQAVTVLVSITGTVTGVNDHSFPDSFNNSRFSDLSIGDTVTGLWGYDTSTPFGIIPISGFPPPSGYFMPSGMSFSTGGQPAAYANFSTDGRATFSSPGSDGRFFPAQAYSVSLQFQPNYFDAIPPSVLDMSAFLFGTMSGSFSRYPTNTISYSANITHVAGVVPLPPAVWLFVSALLALLGTGPVNRLWSAVFRSPRTRAPSDVLSRSGAMV